MTGSERWQSNRPVVLKRAKPAQPTCTRPVCPEWPHAPVVPGHASCAVCLAAIEARAAELVRRAKEPVSWAS
jgi:hypothetical protein